jgi:hypothetical protein
MGSIARILHPWGGIDLDQVRDALQRDRSGPITDPVSEVSR